jgi:hypothetical protein
MNPKDFGKSITTTTYKLTVDSCECNPKIVATFDEVPADKLETALYYAERAFRSVEVVSNTTGEVYYSRYVSVEMFEKRLNNYGYGEALDIIKHEITH